MGGTSATPDVVAQHIRFALAELRTKNGHHRFEDLCRYWARARISRNVRPATGPVSAGGDQGRDFETFQSFMSVDGELVIAFACTLQYKRIPTKVRSDVEKIVAGRPVHKIYALLGENLPQARQDELQRWSHDQHGVELFILDRGALAEELAEPDVFWIAQRCLDLPDRSVLENLLVPGRAASFPRSGPELIGRDGELADAAASLRDSGSRRPVVTITGQAGVGKSAFAIALACSVEPLFPDGCYLIEAADARDDGCEPDLVGMLCDALDGGIERSPQTRAQQIAHLRVKLSGTRVLIVVDDVKSEAALDDLLGVSDAIAVICTSRSRLTGMGIYHAQAIELQPLSEDASASLALHTAPRLSEADARTLASICGGLPLAVLIAAAYVRGRPRLDVPEYLGRLADPDSGLAELTAGGRSMIAIIETSYQSLDHGHVRLIQALGILPNAIVTVDIVASATIDDVEALDSEHFQRTRRLLDDLFELNLVQQPDSDGYRLHNVLYRFARVKASLSHDSWRRQVVRNGCLMYAARLRHAAEQIGFIDADAPAPSATNQHGLAMWEKDRLSACALVETACQAGDWESVHAVSNLLLAVLRHLSHWDEMDRVACCMKLAGEGSGNYEWTTRAMLSLGLSEEHRGNFERAFELYRTVHEIAAQNDDSVTGVYARAHYGGLLLAQGYLDEGIAILRTTLRAWRLLGEDAMLTQVLFAVSGAYLASGRFRRAESYVRNSMAVARRSGFGALIPKAGVRLAAILRESDKDGDANSECMTALRLARSIGSRDSEAAALMELSRGNLQLNYEVDRSSCIASALKIYQEIGDLTGQITALRLRGEFAKHCGQMDLALQFLDESARLAIDAGENLAAAQALSLLSDMYGTIGHHDLAGQLLEDAKQIAAATGNEMLVADISTRESFQLRRLGNTKKSIALLRQTVQILAKKGRSNELAGVRALLGEALLHNNQWEEAARILRPLADAPSGQVSALTRASALRYLSVLYSKRGLWKEAENAANRALSLAIESGCEREVMDCHIALGNFFARMDRLDEAIAQYQSAKPIAEKRQDLSTLMVIANNSVNHALAGGSDEDLKQWRDLIRAAKKLGNLELEATLHLNLGSCLARRGDFDMAAKEITTGREIVQKLENWNLTGRADLLLAKVHADAGDKESAVDASQKARRRFEADRDWPEAAAALRCELAIRLQGLDECGIAEEWQSVVRDVPAPVRGALYSSLGAEAVQADQPVDTGSIPRRQIEIADDVRIVLERRGGIDVNALCAVLASDVRRHCFVCRLPIATNSKAVLMALIPQSSHQVGVTLAHSVCTPSAVVDTAGQPLESAANWEIECVRMACGEGIYLSSIIVDCIGGRVIDENGNPSSIALEYLQKKGFEKVSGGSGTLTTPSPMVLESGKTQLQAKLVGRRLSLHYGDEKIFDGPVMFNPEWYRDARNHKILIAMFGTNLEGMFTENPNNVVRAAQDGCLVGAVMDLTVTTPARNKPCVCETPGRRKFRHCCGLPT